MFWKVSASIILLAALVLNVPMPLVKADDSGSDIDPADVIDINGKAYMAFIPFGANGPSPTGKLGLPVYMVFGQEGTQLYGTLIVPEYQGQGGPTPPQGDLLELVPYTMTQGQLKRQKLKVSWEDYETLEIDQTLAGKFTNTQADILKSAIKSRQNQTVKFDSVFCHEDNNFDSGVYIGQVTVTGAAPPSGNNSVIGVIIQGNTASVSHIFIDPSLGEGARGRQMTVDYNASSGKVSYSGEPTMNGTIKNGVLEFTSVYQSNGPSAEGRPRVQPSAVTITGRLYQFDTKKWRKPKIKSIVPDAVGAGTEAVIDINIKNVPIGSVLTQDNPNCRILLYRHYGKKLQVVIDIGVNATGNVNFTVTTPRGQTATKAMGLIY